MQLGRLYIYDHRNPDQLYLSVSRVSLEINRAGLGTRAVDALD